jgi:hypothetical protein
MGRFALPDTPDPDPWPKRSGRVAAIGISILAQDKTRFWIVVASCTSIKWNLLSNRGDFR